MTQTVEHTDTFDVCDGDTRHKIHEYTVFTHSVAGGIPRKAPADRYYKTAKGASVSHQQHKTFKLPGVAVWLERCDTDGGK